MRSSAEGACLLIELRGEAAPLCRPPSPGLPLRACKHKSKLEEGVSVKTHVNMQKCECVQVRVKNVQVPKQANEEWSAKTEFDKPCTAQLTEWRSQKVVFKI